MVDTHAHLDDEAFEPDRHDVITRALERGVRAIVTIGTSLESSRQAIRLAETYPQVYAVIGLHPTHAEQWTVGEEDLWRDLAQHPRVVGIGETGLDYYWKTCPPEVQANVFRIFLRLAKETQKPVVIHNRDASDDVLRIVQEETCPELCGIMHCFSGNADQMRQSLDLNFYISFAGNVTYKKSALSDIVPLVPADRILVETDCPYLTPVPHRGKRNEPAHVFWTAGKIAECRGWTDDETADRLTRNAATVFRLNL